MEASTKVLIVGDHEHFVHSVARSLVDQGYACVEAIGGSQARALLAAEADITVLLCDINVPGGTGHELLAELAADFRDLAVVMMTGADNPDGADGAFDAYAFARLIKPFDTDALLASLADALRRQALRWAQGVHLRALEHVTTRSRMLGAVLEELEVGTTELHLADEEMIEQLSRAISPRDEETGPHLERMSRYAVVLARAVGFAQLPDEDLRLAIALHDVGKIGVPDSVLLQPGSLSSEERTTMQQHARIGYRLLANSTSDLLQVGARIALAHHEWWDGSGYPRSLQGTEIPEEARIAAVADVFDALTSDRVYRPALAFDEAIAIMGQLRGLQFEPRLVEAFLGSIDEISELRAAYPEHVDLHERIRVLVVDDHALFVHGLVRLLASKIELNVVATASSVSEAIGAALAHDPDVILMDFDLPDGSGLQATEQIKVLMPSVKVIMLTAHTDDQALVDAIAAGCSGFVKKEEAADDLFEAITAAHQGEMIAPQSILIPLLRRLRKTTSRGLGADLTQREREVLELIAAGSVNKQIAAQLGLKLNTVRNHTQNILYKLDVHSKLEAVAAAVREGIIEYPGELVSP